MHSQHLFLQTISVGVWNRLAYREGWKNAGTEEHGRQIYSEGKLVSVNLIQHYQINRQALWIL